MAELILSDGNRSYDFLAGGDIYVQSDGISLPVVSNENTFAETPDSEGRVRIRTRAQNPEGSFAVFVKGATDDVFWNNVDDLQELVASAHSRRGTLAYCPGEGAATVTFDLESISVSELPQRGVMLRQRHGEATVTLETKPYGRLEPRQLQLGESYADYVKTLDCEFFLTLGATNGLTDLSGNGRNGTAAGGITIGGVSSGPLVVGDDGATGFDGSDDRVTTTYAPFANGVARTFMGWAYRSSGAATGYMIGSAASSSFFFGRNAAGTGYLMRTDASNAGTEVTWLSALPAVGQWFHWALVINESTDHAQLFINGVSIGTESMTGTFSSPGNFQIGSRASTSGPWYGGQAWVSVHERALTADEIKLAYLSGLASLPLAGPIDSFEAPTVPGQVEAWGNLALADDTSEARNHVEVGWQHDFDPDNPEPILFEAVTDLTAIAGTSTTRSGSHSTNVIRATLSDTPVTLCASGPQPHKGLWKLRARVYPTTTNVRVRLTYRLGDAQPTECPWVSVPGSGDWYDVDLGTVNIREMPSGHTVEFRVDAKSVSGLPSVDVDLLMPIPADNHSRLRGSSGGEVLTSGLVAADDFDTHSNGALTGKTPPLAPSGNWSGAGDATDFVIASKRIYRNATLDSDYNNGRFARCGTGVIAACRVSLDTFFRSNYTPTDGYFGMFLRYVNTSNYLAVVYISDFYLAMFKVIGGTPDLIGLSDGPFIGWRTLTCTADALGDVAVYESQKGFPPELQFTVTGDSALATSGTLDDGGYGIYDANPGSDSWTRYYDNFSVSSLASSAIGAIPAIYPDRHLELLHNTAVTEDADGDALAITPIREGKYLTLPPSTRSGQKSRAVVRARRQDVDAGQTDTGLDDSLVASLSVTPRVHLTGT